MKPNLIVVAGPNGSGKTTITEKLLRHEWMEGCEYINPDVIAQEQFGGWDSPKAILEAADFAQNLREKCLNEGKSIAFETVFSIPEKLQFLHRARDAGFFVRLFFICTNDPTINAQRVAIRVMEGGHDVPITKIVKRYYRSIANCVDAISIADRVYFYDNSETDCDPLLIFKTVDGEVAKIYHPIVPWAKDIVSQISSIQETE
jgi:predicted ABC-type ATPase